jgi:hypothetical protein
MIYSIKLLQQKAAAAAAAEAVLSSFNSGKKQGIRCCKQLYAS